MGIIFNLLEQYNLSISFGKQGDCLVDKFSIVHHSCVIEGSTLTESETELLLSKGIVPKEKPMLHSLMEQDNYKALLFTLDLAKENKNLGVENLIDLFILIVMATLTYFLSVGMLTIMELGGTIGLLFGTYCLTHSRQKLGWVLYAFGHSCTVYVGYHKLQWVFAIFQMLSVIVSMYGFLRKEKQTKE